MLTTYKARDAPKWPERRKIKHLHKLQESKQKYSDHRLQCHIHMEISHLRIYSKRDKADQQEMDLTRCNNCDFWELPANDTASPEIKQLTKHLHPIVHKQLSKSSFGEELIPQQVARQGSILLTNSFLVDIRQWEMVRTTTHLPWQHHRIP